MLNWILFVVLAVVGYVGIALMGQFSGGVAPTALGSALNVFTKPYALLGLILGNGVWAIAVYYGLKETRLAIPMAIAIGVLTTFVYSVCFLDGQITPWRVAGLALILAGIYLLA